MFLLRARFNQCGKQFWVLAAQEEKKPAKKKSLVLLRGCEERAGAVGKALFNAFCSLVLWSQQF